MLSISNGNKDAPVHQESHCVQEPQDLGSLILLVLKVGISPKTGGDQTAGRGITVSTHDFLSSSPLRRPSIISPQLSARPSVTRYGSFDLKPQRNLVISLTSSARFCSTIVDVNGQGV